MESRMEFARSWESLRDISSYTSTSGSETLRMCVSAGIRKRVCVLPGKSARYQQPPIQVHPEYGCSYFTGNLRIRGIDLMEQ